MQFKTDISSLKNKKFFKVKNSKNEFLCALCKAPRQMRYTKNLPKIFYLRFLLFSAFLAWLLVPLLGTQAFAGIIVIWPIAEFINKILYRKEIPCPYCGFDATWYRRDVKVAKKKVENFWSERLPEREEKAEIKKPEAPPIKEDPPESLEV